MNGKQLQACSSAANFSPTVISTKLNYPHSRPFEEDDYPFKEPEVQQQTGKNIDLKDMFSLGDSGSDRMQGTTDINLAGEHSPLNQYPNPEVLQPNYSLGHINLIRSTENRHFSLGLNELFDQNYEFDGFNQLQGKLLSPVLQGKNEQTKDFINKLEKEQQNNVNLSLEGVRNKDAKVAGHSENCSDSMAGSLAPNENIISQQDSWDAPLSVENLAKTEEQKYLRYKNYYKSEQAAQIQRRNPNDPGEIRRRYEEENKKNFAKYSNALKKYEQKKDFFSLHPAAIYNIKTGTFDQPELGKTPNQSLSDPLNILKHGNIFSRMDTEMALFHQASEACGSKKFAKTLFCKDSRTKSESDFLVPGQFLLPDSPRKLVPKKPISLQNEKVVQGPELFLLENGLPSLPDDRPKLYQPIQFYQHHKEILDNDDELQEIAAPQNPPSKAAHRHKTKQGHHHPIRNLLKNSPPKAKPYLMHSTTLAQILHAPDECMRSSMAEAISSPQIDKIEFSQPDILNIVQQPQLQAPQSDSSSSSDEEDDVLGRVISKQKERKHLERVQKDISLGCAIPDLDQIQSQLMQMEVAPISANLIEKVDVTMIEPIIVSPNKTETPHRVSNASGVSRFSLKQASMLESIASEDSSSSQDHLSHAENIKCPEDEDIVIRISDADPNENYQQIIAPIEERKELEPPSHIYERLQEVSSSGKSSPNLPQIPNLDITSACAEDSVMILAENKFINQVQQQQASLEEPVVTDISPPSEYFKLSLELFSLRQKYQEECKSDSEIQVLSFEQSPVSFKEEKPEKITPNKYQLRERNAMSKEQKTLCSQISKEFTAIFGLPLPQTLMDSQEFRDALTKFHNYHHPPLSKNRKLDIVAHETDTESYHIKFNFLRQQYNMIKLGKSAREVVEIPDDDDVQLPKKRTQREEDTPQLGRKRLLNHKDDSKLFKYSLKSNKISIPLLTGIPSKNPGQKPSLLQNGDSSCLPLLLDDEDSL